MEKEVYFFSGDYRLEGLLFEGSTDDGVVVTHPHPLYGGDMYNPVVETIVGAYGEKGFRLHQAFFFASASWTSSSLPVT